MADYKSQLAELTRISTLLQTQPTAELMQKQAKLQYSVNMLGQKIGVAPPQQARAPPRPRAPCAASHAPQQGPVPGRRRPPPRQQQQRRQQQRRVLVRERR